MELQINNLIKQYGSITAVNNSGQNIGKKMSYAIKSSFPTSASFSVPLCFSRAI